MAEESLEDRTEPATPRKRMEAKSKGNVARSGDLAPALLLLAAIITMYLYSGEFYVAFNKAFTEAFTDAAFADEQTILVTLFKVARPAAMALLPVLVVIIIMAVCGNLLQIGFLITFDKLKWNIEKLDPISNLKSKIFSLQSVVRFIMGILKLTVIGMVLFFVLWGERVNLLNLIDTELGEIMGYMLWMAYKISLIVAIMLILLAIIDYIYQKWQYENQLKMSKHEVKEELKRYEGDPKVKRRRLEMYRKVAYKRMLQQVPKASVVITNPTEIAIAIRYDEETDSAPVIVAKGMRHLAEKIREIAFDNGIPILERKPLARALYKKCEVGDTIPEELYIACAEVLAYVYMLRQKLKAGYLL